MKQKNYYAGIYVRLSNDDERKGDSVSIENQKILLTQYVKEQGWELVEVYTDDGYSGTNFERPGFQKMLGDIKEGKINLIIVKDLSRLGRNHIQVGQFTENILPACGCRFIALNNNIDTLNRDSSCNDMMGFLNLFNEFHSRDTSRKVKSVKKACAERGFFLGTYAPYGYKKDPEDRHKLIIDAETAPVVQRLFALRCEGKSFRGIALLLNEEHITSPREMYYHRKNTVNPQKENGLWSESTVKKMLRSEVYIGHMVQGKVGTLSYKSRKIITKDQEEWIRVENTHEALIDHKVWEQVRALDNKQFRTRKRKADGQNSMFTGLVLCADCGFKMRCQVEQGLRKSGLPYKYVSFLCGNYSRSGKEACTSHTIYENALKALVLMEIREKARLVTYNEDDILKEISRENDRQNTDRRNLYQSKVNISERRQCDLERLIANLYEDWVKGTIPKRVCQSLLLRFKKEQQECAACVGEMKHRLEETQKDIWNVKNWSDNIKKYFFLEELDQEILLELIDRIEIGEAKKINGNRVCEVKIIYRVAGDFSGTQLERTAEKDVKKRKRIV